MSFDNIEAVLWKVRSSSFASVGLYRPLEDGGGGGGLDWELIGVGGRDWHKLKNSTVRSFEAIVDLVFSQMRCATSKEWTNSVFALCNCTMIGIVWYNTNTESIPIDHML